MKQLHIQIPDEIAARTDISWLQKAILGLLGRFQAENRCCSSSKEWMAQALGTNVTQIKRELKTMPPADLKQIRQPRAKIGEAGKPENLPRNPPTVYIVTWALERARAKAHARLHAESNSKLLRFPTDSKKDS